MKRSYLFVCLIIMCFMKGVFALNAKAVSIRMTTLYLKEGSLLLEFAVVNNYLFCFPSDLKDCFRYVPRTDSLKYGEPVVSRNAVVICEIMADPSPSFGLPEYEYIELQNRMSVPIEITGWHLKIGNTVRVLPTCILDSMGRVVVVSKAALQNAKWPSNTLSISSLSIPNNGVEMVLSDENNCVIHAISFTSEWYQNSLKEDGGWSLEMVDTDNPCAGIDNWKASVADSGGTPGMINSVAAFNPDNTLPELLFVAVMDSVTLCANFSESVFMSNPNSVFRIDNHINIDTCYFLDSRNTQVQIITSSPLKENCIYKLQIVDSICDCVRNELSLFSTVSFGLPQKPLWGDLIINEVLSNPFGSANADFIELFNRSDKIISLSDIWIANEASSGNYVKVKASSLGIQLFPKTFWALCKSKSLTMEHYYCPLPNQLISIPDLPNFPGDEGVVVIFDNSFHELDRLAYDKSMHYSMLRDFDGVSLERIHIDGLTQDSQNWISASSLAGFATPGYKNSQCMDDEGMSCEKFTLSSSLISPDGDGIDDIIDICFHNDVPCERCSLKIYNQHGQLVKVLLNNVPLGRADCIIWDGVISNGSIAPPGFYLIYLNCWNNSGKVIKVKKVVGVVN